MIRKISRELIEQSGDAPPQFNQLGGVSIAITSKWELKPSTLIRPATILAYGAKVPRYRLQKSPPPGVIPRKKTKSVRSTAAIVRDELTGHEYLFYQTSWSATIYTLDVLEQKWVWGLKQMEVWRLVGTLPNERGKWTLIMKPVSALEESGLGKSDLLFDRIPEIRTTKQ